MEETTAVQPAASSKKWLWIGLGIVILVVLVFIFGGARGTGFGSAYFAPGLDVDRNIDGSTTYTNEEGSVTVGTGGNMPDNWPSDAPEAYTNANILYSGSTNPATGAAGSAVAYTVTASVDSVVEYYRSRLTAEGWTITATADAAGMKVITATKDTRTFGAYIGSDGQGNTSVTAGIEL